MASTLAEQLTDRFYAWELRGRGWYVFDAPITPEPPFAPFLAHRVDGHAITDDGRRQTLVGSLLQLLSGQGKAAAHTQTETVADVPDQIELDGRGPLTRLAVIPPRGRGYPQDLAEQFLLNLAQANFPVCLEFTASGGHVAVHLSVDATDAATVTTLLNSHYPDVVVTPDTESPSEHAWAAAAGESLIVEFGLAEECVLPLRSYRSFEPDPLIGAIASLASMGRDEVACLHILFERARQPWAQCIRHAVTTADGRPFFANSPELTREAVAKLASPLYGAVIRAAACSPHAERPRQLIRQIAGALTVLDKPGGNRLIPLDNELYTDATQHWDDFQGRVSRRSGMLLSADELLSLVHLPGPSVNTSALVRTARRTKRAPETARGTLVMGENLHAGESVSVGLGLEQRLRHTHLIGASGTGKSTLLANMIRQDIQASRGVGVLDPHGDLIDTVLADIPPERSDDVVLLDLADDQYPVPFNILSAHSELDKTLLASDLTAVFQRLATSWGDQMTAVLANAILAFLESTRGGTLADLRRFLVEKPYREEFLTTVEDPEVCYYWQHEYALTSGKPQGSVVTRLNTFLRPKSLRYMVAHGENRLNVGDIMDSGKIFLARIPQGAIGEENAYLLGTLLVSAFHRSALARQEKGAENRRPFFLYIDEFHHFVTPSMAQILSGARKYAMGLILAHQELRQLEGRDSDVASAVLSNPGTRVCFRLGDQDARKLESGFGFFQASDLQSLGVGQAIGRIERSEFDFNLDVPMPPEARSPDEVEHAVAEIRKRSRARYAVPRAEVEALLSQGRESTSIPKQTKPSAPIQKPAKPTVVPRSKETTPTPQSANELTSDTPSPSTPETPAPTAQNRPMSGAGRGGLKHKSIQRLIKHWAEGMGYRAQIEKPILDGRGAVDVALYKGEESIACEISITTPTDHECANLEKCIRAEFNFIVMLTDDEEHLSNIEKQAKSAIDPEVFSAVYFMMPKQFFRFIEEREQAQVNEAASIRGYKVTVNKSAGDATRRSIRMKSIRRTIGEAALGARKASQK